jgi:hypothetical protein
MVNLAKEVVPVNMNAIPQMIDDSLHLHGYGTQLINQTAALYDQISSTFNNVMTRIDGDTFCGNEKELFTYQPAALGQVSNPPSEAPPPAQLDRGVAKRTGRDAPKGQTTAVAATVVSGSYFAKVELYANSRLPMNLPPLRLLVNPMYLVKCEYATYTHMLLHRYIPTWPLLCLAAQYSERVYDNPRGAERDAHVNADWRTGTKAMVIKSVPMDHMDTIVFAIRGTATFMDWAVNLNSAPTAPVNFLDDTSNLCHSGFLSVARKMIKPVAARLRQLLEEDPGRISYSLLITGHSAGGAVAALLYSHMLSISSAAESELNILTGCFKRIHCVTFGTPPVSLVPLTKPNRPELKKSLFLSFVNEGDPVARVDKAYVKSLLELFAAPPPSSSSKSSKSSGSSSSKTHDPKKKQSKSSLASKTSKSSSKSSRSSSSSSSKKSHRHVWKVPPSVLSNAGRIVVLRSGDPSARLKGKKTVEERLNEGVIAQTASPEHLARVIWGDPVCHVMRLYSGRIETLAVCAVTGKSYS